MTAYEIVSTILAFVSIVVAVVSIIVSVKTKKKCEKYIVTKIETNNGTFFNNVEGDVNGQKQN